MSIKNNPDEYEDRLDEEYESPLDSIDEDVLNDVYKKLEKQNVKVVSSQDELRTNLMTFLSGQMENVNRENNLKELIEKEIAMNITLHQYSPEMLMTLYKIVNQQKAVNVTTITDIFKPTNATPNMVLTQPKQEDESKNLEITPEKQQVLDKLSKLLGM